MIGGGLSLDQSPPFFSSGRFFLTAPIFIVLAGLVLLFKDITVVRSSPYIVTIVHLFTLGVFTMIMFGAIQQMLPVLAGVKMPKAHLISKVSHVFLVLGTILFAYGFLTDLAPIIMISAATLLFTSFLLVLGGSLYAIREVQKFSPTVKAMTIAMTAGLITAMLGAWMMQNYVGEYSDVHYSVMFIHMVLGIFGFAGILIIGVAFKIIPMFYVTPGFKNFCKTWVAWLIVVGLVLWTVLTMFMPSYQWVAIFVLTTFYTAFSTTVILKLNRRRRPISDITVWYWRVAGVSLFVGMFVLMANGLIEADLDIFVVVLIGGGFLLSILTGMLYKIVPFLVWFHLNAKGHFEIPTMREMLNKNMAKAQFVFHILALISVMLSVFFPISIKLAGLAFIISGTLMLLNLLSAVKVYIKMKDVEVPDMMAEFMKMSADVPEVKDSKES